MRNDRELLNEYAAEGSEEAFRQLVERHAGMVRATSRRMVRSDATADEVTQAVFLLMARKAKELRSETVLAGWLYRTARFVSLQALRSEHRRMRRDDQFAQMISEADTTLAWEHIEGRLEVAMAQLSDADRDAIVLRFFEDLNFAQVAAGLGITEAAAKMRVSRSLEKLRRALRGGGISIGSALLLATLSAHATSPIPAETLVTQLIQTSTSSTSTRIVDLATETMKMTANHKLKTGVIAAMVALVLGSTAVFLHFQFRPEARELSEKSSAISFLPMEGEWEGTLSIKSDSRQAAPAEPVLMTVTLSDQSRACAIDLKILRPDGGTVVRYQFRHAFSNDGKQILTTDDPKVARVSGIGSVTENQLDAKAGNWSTTFRTAASVNKGFSECRWMRQGDTLTIVRQDHNEVAGIPEVVFSEMMLHRRKGSDRK